MAFFRNSTVNLLNLHYGIHSIVLTGGGAFFGVYLLKSGVPVPYLLAALAAILGGRFIFRPSLVPLAVRVGMRPLVFAGTVLTALQYPLLARVHGVGWPLFALLLMSAIGDTFYWTSYHAYFAALGDDEHRGHQIGVREAIAAVVGIVSPLVTGWVLVRFGPMAAFGMTCAVLVLAALPFIWTPDVPVARETPGAFRAALPGIRLFLADGWIASGFYFAWQLALFQTLGENFLAYGGALALSAVVGAVAGLFLGRNIDAGHGTRAVWIAGGAFAATILLRAAVPGHPAFAIAANAMGALVVCLYTPTLMTAVYNLAKRAPCPLRFHAATEGAWDIGGASGCLIGAALTSFGVSLSVSILLALIGITASSMLLHRYYAANPVAITVPLSADYPVN